MLTETLNTLFQRDLEALKKEIGHYEREETLWQIADGISNSGGNLCLHIVGNLNHFIGAVLGNTGYIRQRSLEFSQKDIGVSELIEKIEATQGMIKEILATLTQDDLKKGYALEVFGHAMTTEYFLVHLTMHLSYHLGQINYHRRLLG